MLHDGELEITEEKLNKVLTASGNSVEGYWPGLFAKALRGKDVGALLSNAGSASAGPAPAASGAPEPVFNLGRQVGLRRVSSLLL